MVTAIKSFVHSLLANPLRGVLTLLTIAVGVGALIISFGLSFETGAALERSLASTGRRVVIANASLADDGTITRQMPSLFRADTGGILERDYERLSHVTPVSTARWQRISADGTSYQVRRAFAVGAGYADLMDLTFVSESFFSEADAETGRTVVVLSESAARILFGSPEAATGRQVQTAMPGLVRAAGVGTRMGSTQTPFTVVGVYADLPELTREAYGVGDFLIPYGVNLPRGIPAGLDPSAVLVGRLTADPPERAESRIRAILELEYGDDVAVAVWQGAPGGPTPLIEESRRAVSSFVMTVNALGLLILAASSIGIFSVMLVEVVNRTREIGLRRAIGATRAGIRRFFVSQAVLYATGGAILGTGIALAFYRAVGASLAPFFETSGLSPGDLDLSLPGARPVFLAIGAAVVVGALFGAFPAVSASRIPIVDAIRDDNA